MTGPIDTLRWNATFRMPPSLPIRTLVRARLYVSNLLRKRPALTYLSENTDWMGVFTADRAAGPNLTHEEQCSCS
eukprot:1534423-Pyramimonas_sp.AAC.1